LQPKTNRHSVRYRCAKRSRLDFNVSLAVLQPSPNCNYQFTLRAIPIDLIRFLVLRVDLRIPGYPALHSDNIRHVIPEYPALF